MLLTCRIARLIRLPKWYQNELKITLDEALKENPDLKKAYDTEEDVKKACGYVKKT